MLRHVESAWKTDGLTPGQKLLFIYFCDAGMSQTTVMLLDDLLQVTGHELDDLHGDLGVLGARHLIRYGTWEQFGETFISVTTVFAQHEEPRPRRQRREYYQKKSIPKGLRKRVFERDDYTCVYCGTEVGPFRADHILPESRGGEMTIENLVCSCVPCNSSKGTKTRKEFELYLDRKAKEYGIMH